MATRYEVWDKINMSNGRSMPASIHYTLDVSMEQCIKLSKGSTKTKSHRVNPNNPWDYDTIEIDVPNAFALVERDGQSRIRGWGINGKWYDARDCKRCMNTGYDDGDICVVCKGSSFKPNI